MPKLHIYKNEKETCHAFAEWFAELVNSCLERQENFTVAFPGRDVPKLINKILATEFADKIAWNKINIFLEDERLISFSEGDNNHGINTSFENLPVPRENIHTIRSDLSPLDSAVQYDTLLHNSFNNSEVTFDLAILGLSEDGSTFSFFAGYEEGNGRPSWVVPVYDAKEDVYRITLTSNIINASSVKAFVITGKRKQDAVHEVLKGKYNPEKYPAQLIQTANKTVHWFLDEAAADKLIKPTP